ncbi:hypothetical protein CXB51_008030 [Gossypium anomalum]|uniref:Aminotransferase-like plant mobile domain-containing protein n=1 Tax=Gossypium anomalum TaxID=47600 RepID=A0A8J5YV70_9ROSI|nr:hypothetical protein CXB51_008030 [Gossypium anomalum]
MRRMYYHFERRAIAIEIAGRWQHCTGRCAGRRDRIKPKSEYAYHYCNHGHGFAFHFYVLEWNHSLSYVGIPKSLEDIRLLLDQRSEVQFQWTPYEDPAIQAVIPDSFFQNLNIWHMKVPLVNYAIVEMHQSDRVLRQFGFRQLIPVEPEVLNDEHKVDLRLSKCRKIGMTIYLLGNRSLLLS